MTQLDANDVTKTPNIGDVTVPDALPSPCHAARPVPRFDSLNEPVVFSRVLPFMPTVATSALVTAICPTTMLNTHWTNSRIDNGYVLFQGHHACHSLNHRLYSAGA